MVGIEREDAFQIGIADIVPVRIHVFVEFHFENGFHFVENVPVVMAGNHKLDFLCIVEILVKEG